MDTAQNSQKAFRQVLFRNIALPLILSVISGAIFVGLVFYLMSAMWWVDHTDQVISKTFRVQTDIAEDESTARGHLITNQESFLSVHQDLQRRILVELDDLKTFVDDNPVQAGRAQAIKANYESWAQIENEILAMPNREKRVQVVAAGQPRAMMSQVRNTFQQFIAEEENLKAVRSQRARDVATTFLILVGAVSLIFGMIIAVSGRRQLFGLSSIFGEALRTQQEQNSILQRQKWLREGQGRLSEIFVGDPSVSKLADVALTFVAEYAGAQIGSMYVSNERQVFEREAAYAYPAESHPSYDEFREGEGLLGQVVKSRRPLVLKELPEHFPQIVSSLGGGKPRYLVAQPLFADRFVNGVLELGFMQEPEARVGEFLEQISEMMSQAIGSAKYRERLEALLQEVQNQAEELQSQQEELRVNNEELEEQAKILKEAQSRLEAQHAEMEQTNAQLEEQTQMLENQRDALNERNQDLDAARADIENKAREVSQASQYKSEFLANMSHELRTPLNSSLILAKLLADNRDGNLSAKQVEYAEQILSSGNDLLGLINDILDLAKVEAGKLEVSPVLINLKSLAGSMEKTFQPMAVERKLSFSVERAPGLPETIVTDRQRLEQILRNLLSNAFKFTSEGSVALRMSSAAGQPDVVAFSVQDTGIGIASHNQDVIFEAFRQADGTTNRRFGGTGLGLSISRDLAKLLGGRIQVESLPEKGSTFTLFLPAQYAPAEVQAGESKPQSVAVPTSRAAPTRRPAVVEAKPRQASVDDPSSRTLLVVEDDPAFAKIIDELAHEMKYKCVIAGSASEALELIQSHRPQAVLLDMKLPDHSGLMVLDHLKQNPATRHIPVHVVSAQDDAQEALEMGAVGYMLKPVKRDELKKVFALLEAKMGEDIRHVLVVEDDPIQRKAIGHLIEDPRIETTAVGLGKEALEQLKTRSFDCMIIDLNLPDMSGFDLLQRMDDDADHAYPPVIVYTGRDLSREEEDRLGRYSRSVIVKGARSPERLLNEVTLFLHRVEAQLDPARQQMLENLRNREKIFESKKILLVDDDMRNVFALTAALEQKGAKIVIAKNGEESLKRLETDPGIDLVLMDIMMPVMNGYRAMEEIRKQRRFAKLPIIALTAKAMKDDRELCLRAGANDYLAKPVDTEKLLSLIRVLDFIPRKAGRVRLTEAGNDIELGPFLNSVYEKYSYDFRDYSVTSLKRRLGTALTRFEMADLSSLLQKVLEEPTFFMSVLQYLTVPTSEMFRDPPFYLALRTEVVPILRTYASLKIWIAGCSTGEEIYSYAILLKEEGLLDRTMIYATDINPVSLQKAEEGIYGADKIKEFTNNYQKAGGKSSFSDYFTANYDRIMLDKSLKRNVVFADHSLATDSVFSEVQLVSCRNVLIYFNRGLQERAIGLFFESLSHKGFLALGSKETLRFTRYDSLFDSFVRNEKIYRRH